jgi:CBS domain containing-hemolysin-like protein
MNWDAFILTALKILAVLALVLLNGFFVAAEFALVRIRETQLDMLVAKGWRRAQMARHIVRHLNSYLSATQLGITMASLGLGWIGQPVFTTLLSPLLGLAGIESGVWLRSISFAVGFTALTFLHICVGELAPKWLTIQKPLPVALATAIPLRWFYLAFYPFNRLLNLAARISPEAHRHRTGRRRRPRANGRGIAPRARDGSAGRDGGRTQPDS